MIRAEAVVKLHYWDVPMRSSQLLGGSVSARHRDATDIVGGRTLLRWLQSFGPSTCTVRHASVLASVSMRPALSPVS